MNSVLSTLRILEEVAVRQPIGVSELARATQIPKSTVQRCLVTLQEAGWLRVVDAEHARWGVTMKALAIGLRGAGEHDLRQLAAPVIQRLAAQTDETVHLGLRDGTDSVIVARADSTQIVRVFLEIGTRLPLAVTSIGVAILAHLDPREVDELLRADVENLELDKLGGGAPPSDAELRAEIAAAAERRYSMNMSSWFRPHVTSIGAAILDGARRPVAGLALSIPQMRFDPSTESALARMAIDAADEITRLIRSS
ncbi:IclR family transcriptional regulator [Nocardia callitridis]|uniref:IclR family transcriptional regulator n=1 Tax=Nocardia callitridis TaxID=648753 RepID=A0ABP9KPM2_9NOCA